MFRKLIILSCFTVLSVLSTAQVCSPNFSFYTNHAIANFNNSSSFTGVPSGLASYQWDFGDGSAPITSNNPSHSYIQPGSFIVCITMTVSDSITNASLCSSVYCDTITIIASCNNALVTSTTNWSSPATVNFDCSASYNGPSTSPSYFWDFDDGTVSTIKSPTHTYATVGTYSVKLTVDHKNAQGMVLCTDTVYNIQNINNTSVNCSVSFTHNSSSTNPLNFNFTRQQNSLLIGQNIYPINSYSWDFGDGTTSASSNGNQNHTYSQPGTYIVCLTRNVVDSLNNNNVCSSSFCDTIVISNTCHINASSQSYWYTPATKTFTGSSINLIGSASSTLYHWDFGDGNTSISQTPTHTYSQVGNYNVCLTVDHLDNSGAVLCSNTKCFSDSVLFISADCSVNFSAFPSQFNHYMIHFNSILSALAQNTNSNPKSTFLWTFGDGTTANGSNPSHQYNQVGTYIVCFSRTVVDSLNPADSCSYTHCDTISISAVNPNPQHCKAQFHFDSLASGPGNIIFVNSSLPLNNTLYSNHFFWDFGDGTTSNLSYPQHTYTSNGYQTMCLTITSIKPNNDTCISHFCKTFRIDSLGNFHHNKISGPFNINIVPPSNGIGLEEAVGLDFDLFPNPASNSIQIKMGEFMNGVCDYKLMNANGSVISIGSINESKSTINVSDLANGIYFINLSNSETSLNRKFQVIR